MSEEANITETAAFNKMLETVVRESFGAGFYHAIVKVGDAIAPHLDNSQISLNIMEAITGLKPDADAMVSKVSARRALSHKEKERSK